MLQSVIIALYLTLGVLMFRILTRRRIGMWQSLLIALTGIILLLIDAWRIYWILFWVGSLILYLILHFKKKRFKFVYKTIYLILLSVCIVFTVLFPVFRLPEPTGQFSVGMIEQEFYSDEQSHPIRTSIRFPIDQNEGERLPYFSDTELFVEQISEEYSVPSMLLSQLEKVQSHSHAAGSDSLSEEEIEYPVILLSHGFPGSRFFLTHLAEELTSQGYVTVSIDHPGYSIASTFKGEKIIGMNNQLPNPLALAEWDAVVEKEWLPNIRTVLSGLNQMNEEKFGARLDLKNVGVIGHSFGGASAFQAMQQIDDVTIGVNLDGTHFGEPPQKRLEKPYLYLKADPREASTDQSNAEVNQKLIDDIEQRSKWASYLAVREYEIEGASHMNFTDFVNYSPLLRTKSLFNASTITLEINKSITSFLDEFYRD